MDQKKIKVVWLCHFANDNIQNILKPRKRLLEFAPWITLGIKEVEKRKDLELHIVSPHRWIAKNTEFDENNIFYHFFNPGIPFYGRHWPWFFRFDILQSFKSNKKKVKKFIDKIKPDIIHLHGIENAYYSSTVLQFKEDYPILATIQGFISLNLSANTPNKNNKVKISTEKEILNSLLNFGVRTKAMKKEILKYNSKAIFYWHETFMNIANEKIESDIKKPYDLIYFAKVTKDKGVEDLIDCTNILKATIPEIKIAIIGTISKAFEKKIKKKIINLKCQNNIDLLGFLPQETIYKILANSKICVLPTYNDSIPGTIIESMFRKVPVVSYKTGGIPDINMEKENILLSEQGDIKGLSISIKNLLMNDSRRKELADNAYNYAINRWNNEKALNHIIEAYKKILGGNC